MATDGDARAAAPGKAQKSCFVQEQKQKQGEPTVGDARRCPSNLINSFFDSGPYQILDQTGLPNARVFSNLTTNDAALDADEAVKAGGTHDETRSLAQAGSAPAFA
jgi:hypothetical protein